MGDLGADCCPVCWRAYTCETKPFLIVCGHTFCQDCLNDIRVCPLCRTKIPARYPGATNYSLLSLIENRTEGPVAELVSAFTQTEDSVASQSITTSAQESVRAAATKSSSCRKQKKVLKFKISRDSSGEMEGLEICLN